VTQQARPDPHALYERAVRRMHETLANVQPAQLGNPTPCSEWDVQALITHVIYSQEFLAPEAGTDAIARMVGDKSIAGYFDRNASKFVEFTGIPGVIESAIDGYSLGDPGIEDFLGVVRRDAKATGWDIVTSLLMASFMDTLVHSWDISVSTGQDATLPEDLAQVCYTAYAPLLESHRAIGGFAPELATAGDSSVQAKLLCLMGRSPTWPNV
jgi:hypothetical protein